jgi:SAM-dependent methyltransferase
MGPERRVSRPTNERTATRSFFWPLYATVYDLIWDSPLTDALAEVVVNGVPSDGLLIDLGCGTGLMTRSHAGHTIGVDTSAAMLTRATASHRIDEAVLARAEATGLPEGIASAVVVSNVLHLHPEPRVVIEEALRLCTPAGRIFLFWPLDEPTTDAIFEIDRLLGRAVPSALLANALRRLVGVVAALTRTSRTASARIEQAVVEADGHEIVLDTVLLGCQRFVILRPSSTAVS